MGTILVNIECVICYVVPSRIKNMWFDWCSNLPNQVTTQPTHQYNVWTDKCKNGKGYQINKINDKQELQCEFGLKHVLFCLLRGLQDYPTLLFYSGESVLFCVHGKVSDCCFNYYFLLGKKLSTLATLSNGKLRAETVSLFLDDGFNSDVSSIPLLKCSNLDCLCNMSLHVTKIQTSTLLLFNKCFYSPCVATTVSAFFFTWQNCLPLPLFKMASFAQKQFLCFWMVVSTVMFLPCHFCKSVLVLIVFVTCPYMWQKLKHQPFFFATSPAPSFRSIMHLAENMVK